jgi:cytochrome c553
MTLSRRLLLPALLVVAQGTLAQGAKPPGTAPAERPPLDVRGSADAGARLATQGAEGIAACGSCHAPAAVTAARGTYPYLESHDAFYLRKQLADFASGARPNPVMSAIAKQLSPGQMADAAVHYAGQRLPMPGGARAGAASAGGRGATIALVGDAKSDTQACSNCHGGDGRGAWPSVPWIAGQPAGYIAAQLRAFRDGTRRNDEVAQMRSAVARLGDADIDAVARYYAALRPAGAAPMTDRMAGGERGGGPRPGMAR